jgi:hypothetical protein
LRRAVLVRGPVIGVKAVVERSPARRNPRPFGQVRSQPCGFPGAPCATLISSAEASEGLAPALGGSDVDPDHGARRDRGCHSMGSLVRPASSRSPSCIAISHPAGAEGLGPLRCCRARRACRSRSHALAHGAHRWAAATTTRVLGGPVHADGRGASLARPLLPDRHRPIPRRLPRSLESLATKWPSAR